MPEVNEHGQQVGDVVAGWDPRPRARAVRLPGHRVSLAPLALADAPALHEALCGPDDDALWTYRTTSRPVDLAATTDLVQAHLEAVPGLETFVLVPTGQPPAGLASFLDVDVQAGRAEIGGVLLARRLQRTTAATEAIHLLLAHAFDDLGYRRLVWKCDSLNEPSRRAATRLGFQAEGRFRHHLVVKGRNRDTDWFSLTDEEWPAVRAAHRRWLAPDNVDAAGRQRVSLGTLTAVARQDTAQGSA